MTIAFAADLFQFEPASGLLLRAGVPVRLGRRGAALLGLFLRRRGQAVSKDDLLEAGWGHNAIEESNLSVQIALLRKTIGRTQTGGEWIMTLPRLGYRFLPEPASTIEPARKPTLGFVSFSGSGSGSDFAASLSEDVLVKLSAFGSVALAARTHPGPDDYLLSGSVRASGSLLRVSVRLLAGSSRHVVWAGNFDMPSAAGIRAADRLANVLVARVEAAVMSAEIVDAPTKPMDESSARELYLSALAAMRGWRAEDNSRAVALLDATLLREPDKSEILAAACEARASRISMGWPKLHPDDEERCRQLALHGLRQQGADAAALALFGGALFRTGDLDFGLDIMERAAALNPNDVTALLWAGTGSMHWGSIETAERYFRRAVRLGPNDLRRAYVLGGLARIHMMRGHFGAALDWAMRGMQFCPPYAPNHWTVIAARTHLGLVRDAERGLDQFRLLQPGITVSAIRKAQATRENRMTTTLDGLEQAGLSPSAG